jgi:acylphosphatase
MPTKSEPERVSLRLRIEGAVQGVGYRAFAIGEARRLGLDGWVRNRADDTVEVQVCGDTAEVESFVRACLRGPSGAKVTNIDVRNCEPPEEKGFRQRPTL